MLLAVDKQLTNLFSLESIDTCTLHKRAHKAHYSLGEEKESSALYNVYVRPIGFIQMAVLSWVSCDCLYCTRNELLWRDPCRLSKCGMIFVGLVQISIRSLQSHTQLGVIGLHDKQQRTHKYTRKILRSFFDNDRPSFN